VSEIREEKFEKAGYFTEDPCVVCGKRPAKLEPRFYYAFCIDHMDTPPAEILNTKAGDAAWAAAWAARDRRAACRDFEHEDQEEDRDMILQEKYGRGADGEYDPWRIAVICIILNRTRSSKAEVAIDKFFDNHPNARSMAHAEINHLEFILRPLGLSRKHAEAIVEMTKHMALRMWNTDDHPEWSALYGVGEYAADALRLFIDRDFSVEPHDLYLREYKRREKRKACASKEPK